MMIKSRFHGSSSSSNSNNSNSINGGTDRRRRGCGVSVMTAGQHTVVMAAVWLHVVVLMATAAGLICRTTAFQKSTTSITTTTSHSGRLAFVTLSHQQQQLHHPHSVAAAAAAATRNPLFVSPCCITPSSTMTRSSGSSRLTTTTGLYASVLSNHNDNNGRKNQALLFQLSAASSSTMGQQIGDDEDDDEEDDDGTGTTSSSSSSSSSRARKRDRLRDWLSSKSPMSPMVQMQRVGRSADDDDEDEDDDVDDEPADTTSSIRQPPQRRVKARLESLFSGMPSMNEILYGPTKGNNDDDDDDTALSFSSNSRDDDDSTFSSSTSRFSRSGIARSSGGDDAWFREEKQSIMDEFENMLKDMLQKIEEQRRVDPEAVPENAPAMIKSVLRQEMYTEIAETKERRSQERLAEYEREKRATLAEEEESGVVSIAPNSRVQRLMDESQAEYDQQDATRAQLDEFLAYEAEAFKRASREAEQQEASSWSSSSNIVTPQPEADLDQWALERLEAMSNRVEDVDGSEMVQDLLDESVTDLRQRMDKESSQRRFTKPETMKEWQMYRAIATRLAADLDKENENDDDDDDYDDDESARVDSSEMVSDEEILGRLQSWKEYVVKEDRIRTEGGLTRGPKMPFSWQEGDLKDSSSSSSSTASFPEKVADTRSKADVRKQINRMSIEAMESMLANADGARRVKLQAEIDYLKSELEGKDYLDFVDPEEEEGVAGPVDMTGVFQSYDATTDEKEEKIPRPTMPYQTFSQTTPVSPPPPPPSTPFFDAVDVREEVAARQKSPPNTPFFTESQSSSDVGSVGTGDSKLGSMDEQKLQAMYRRANARTREEQDRIRTQWEEFQQLEKAKRQESGLGGSVVDDDVEESSRRAQEAAAAASAAAASRKYNVEDVVSKDGDIDAAKILSAIGPRPGRSKKEAKTEEQVEEKDATFKSSVDKREVEDSLYRSVSAVGGGLWKDDPEAKAKNRAEYSDFLRREREMRQSLDQPTGTDADASSNETTTTTTTFDDVRYAKEAMASLGARPKLRTRKVDARELSDNGGVRGTDQDDDEDDDDDDDDRSMGLDIDSSGSESATIPEWLLRENASNKPKRKRFLNMEDIDEAFDDDQYEKNMRQLAEYEKRRAGKQPRQMGIDISGVLGRRDTEDYKDYMYDDDYTRGRRGGGFGAVSFEGRKANLLEYTELDVVELNALMDHRDSVHATGVSQYLPRINKPFKAFGAIFRIEGVLVDLTGLQLQAWSKVAEAHGFKPPLVEDVRLAAVTQPELAVNHIFVWTDNWLESSKIALTHRRVLSEVFDKWVKENNISTQQALEQPAQRGSLALGEEAVQQQASPSPGAVPTDERTMLDQMTRAWTQTAYKLGRSAPSQEAILSTVSLSPDIAVKKVFRWTVDPQEVDEIVGIYRDSQRMTYGGGREDTPNVDVAPKREPAIKPAPFVLNEAGMMELHYLSWTTVADMFNFERPTSDEVLGAFVLNDPFIAVRDGFGWTSNEKQLKDAVDKFSSTLNALIKEKTGVVVSPPSWTRPEPQPTKQQASQPTPSSPRQGPSKDDIIEMHAQAWVLAATGHRFALPTLEQVQLAMDMTAEDAVRKIFRWTGNDIDLQRAASEFREELKRVSDNYVRKHNLNVKPTTVESGKNTQQGPTVSADDMYQAAFNAWSATASRYGFVWPVPGQVVYAMSVGPEEAIASGFGWADTQHKLNEILVAYKEELAKQRPKFGFGETKAPETGDEKSSEQAIPPVQVNAGAAKWIRSLLDVEMQCATISYLDRMQVNVLLDYAGLSDLIESDKRVSISDGYNRDSQQMLGAALRVERRPDHCLVFDASPYASIAAHDVEMRNVAMIDPYPRYELLSADQTSSGFEELTAMNIRRLFGERIYDQPMLDMQQTEPVIKKKQKTKFFWDDDS